MYTVASINSVIFKHESNWLILHPGILFPTSQHQKPFCNSLDSTVAGECWLPLNRIKQSTTSQGLGRHRRSISKWSDVLAPCWGEKGNSKNTRWQLACSRISVSGKVENSRGRLEGRRGGGGVDVQFPNGRMYWPHVGGKKETAKTRVDN